MHRMCALLGILAASAAIGLGSPTAEGRQQAASLQAPGTIEFKDPSNAALLYYKAWLDPVFGEVKGPCAEQLQGSDPTWKPDATLTKLLDDHQGWMRMVLRATAAPEADFGVEFSEGINALLPHLGYMRATARVMACDARRCMAAGDMDGACERVAAMYRMARHCTQDHTLISALVSIAITSLADSQTQIIIDTNRLTADGKRMLLPEAQKLAEPDAWAVKRGIEGERFWTTGWLRSIATGPDAGKKLVDQLTPMMNAPANGDVYKQIAKMDEDEVAKLLDDANKFYDDVLKVWDDQDAVQKLHDLEEAMGKGTYGIIAQCVVPALTKSRQSDTKARAEHAALLKKLEYHIPIGR
jgi:hypothetical protein